MTMWSYRLFYNLLGKLEFESIIDILSTSDGAKHQNEDTGRRLSKIYGAVCSESVVLGHSSFFVQISNSHSQTPSTMQSKMSGYVNLVMGIRSHWLVNFISTVFRGPFCLCSIRWFYLKHPTQSYKRSVDWGSDKISPYNQKCILHLSSLHCFAPSTKFP